eukprot:GHVO01022098.1.p1 GENE.GHVO01022098.1~~GHVO01022098.1.p1  ORF type:complete len:156 (-),score=20.62 GHVO01022098.1:410-877(-)
MRFTFDLRRMDMVKINDYFEFPDRIDMSEFVEDAGTYSLHSVIVHKGDVHSGHYFAYIRPGGTDQWVRFEDDKVENVSQAIAVNDNFGGADKTTRNYLAPSKFESREKPYSAYILFYVKDSEKDELLRIPDPEKVNPWLVKRFNRKRRGIITYGR